MLTPKEECPSCPAIEYVTIPAVHLFKGVHFYAKDISSNKKFCSQKMLTTVKLSFSSDKEITIYLM
jgi:hypothetical protein